MSVALQMRSNVFVAELIQVADAVSREKGLPKKKIIEAVECAIQRVAKMKYGSEHDIRVSVEEKNAAIFIDKCMTVVEEVEDAHCQISLEAAQALCPEAKIGDVLRDALPLMEFDRVAVQMARQIIMQKLVEAERERQYEEFKDRVGHIVSGVVKRVDPHSVTVDINRTEAVIRKENLIPRENFRVGDRLRAYIVEVSSESRGAQVVLSRVHPKFMEQLFCSEVPEIYDGVISVKSVARDAGSRGKIAVYSSDPNIDSIGACVGVRGSRVQAVVDELQGEKIDIVLWSEDVATFVVNALAPAEINKVILDEEKHKFEVVVRDDSLSVAIGRRGQNVRLASQLTGWSIDVMSESDAMEKQNREYHETASVFMKRLDCDEMLSHLLVAEGFSSVEEIAFVDPEELLAIDGFDADLVASLQERALACVREQESEYNMFLDSQGVNADLRSFEELSLADCVALCREGGVKSLSDFADLSVYELTDILPQLDFDVAGALIMSAREAIK